MCEMDVVGEVHLETEIDLENDSDASTPDLYAEFLYDFLSMDKLVWPSLTVQWLPEEEAPPSEKEDNCINRRLLLGTHAKDETNYLIVGQTTLPVKDYHLFNEEEHTIEYIEKIALPSELNRARYMPQRPSIVAAKLAEADLRLFDLSRLKTASDKSVCLVATLQGHSKEGYGLSWNLQKQGLLLSASYDNLICLWDVNSVNLEHEGRLQPLYTFDKHTKEVGDVAWSPKQASLFASVSDDTNLMIWDIRSGYDGALVRSVKAHNVAINCVALNPADENILLTGSSGEDIGVWDLRKMNEAVWKAESYNEEVFSLVWYPQRESVFAVGGSSEIIAIIDLAQIGEMITDEDFDEVNTELMLKQSYHPGRINDISWDSMFPWTLASVCDGGVLCQWKISPNIYDDEELLFDNELLEHDDI